MLGTSIKIQPPLRSRYVDFGNSRQDIGTVSGAIISEANILGLISQTGPNGFQGFQGTQGFVGFQGLVGPTGSPGSAVNIATGPTGFQGYEGVQGFKGVQGYIGYQGNQGLIGPAGTIGLQGYQGPQGNIGLQGIAGSIGSQGIMGPTGQGVLASFLRGSRSTSQTNVIANTTIIFNQVDNSYSNDISLNTSTGVITLNADKTYRIIGCVPDFESVSNTARPSFAWYNRTTSNQIGSLAAAYNNTDAANFGTFGGISECIITPNVSTDIDFRCINASTAITAGGSIDFPLVGSYPWFEIEVIAGNAPALMGSTGPTGFQGAQGLLGFQGAQGLLGFQGTQGLQGPSNSFQGNWTLSPGSNSVSFTVPLNGTYSMWVLGNIPNGIVSWNATATVSNPNVPVLGVQYGWYYLTGNQLVLTFIPDQFVGTADLIITTSPPGISNSNIFNFQITNNSSSNEIVNYGYTKL
jgi:hypothetical protein